MSHSSQESEQTESKVEGKQVFRAAENMLSATEKKHYQWLTVPHGQQGAGYMKPCVLQIIREVRLDDDGDSEELNDLLDAAKKHQDKHPYHCTGDHSDDHHECAHPPEEFICPITLQVMKEPVISPVSGHSFEKEALERWLRNRGEDPTNRQRVSPAALIPNRALKAQIIRWREKDPRSLRFDVCNSN